MDFARNRVEWEVPPRSNGTWDTNHRMHWKLIDSPWNGSWEVHRNWNGVPFLLASRGSWSVYGDLDGVFICCLERSHVVYVDGNVELSSSSTPRDETKIVENGHLVLHVRSRIPKQSVLDDLVPCFDGDSRVVGDVFQKLDHETLVKRLVASPILRKFTTEHEG